jgi:hypothetical protein
MDSQDDFKQACFNWLEIDDQLSTIAKSSLALRKRKGELQKSIIPYARERGVTIIDGGRRGKMKFLFGKSVKTFNEKQLKSLATDFASARGSANEIGHFMEWLLSQQDPKPRNQIRRLGRKSGSTPAGDSSVKSEDGMQAALDGRLSPAPGAEDEDEDEDGGGEIDV